MRAALLALLLIACNSNPGPVQQRPSADWCGGPVTFSVSERQLAELVTIARFGDAYNGGRVEEAMPLLGADFGGSDCDYRQAAAVSFSGQEQTRAWLRQRAADHDRLEIREVYNVNPDQPVGVAGVEWARRANDTLRTLGFGDGIVLRLAAKVVFNRSGGIRAFANGPEGGSASSCRPSALVTSGASTPPPLPRQLDLIPRPYAVGSRWLSPLKTLAAFEGAYAAGNLEAVLALLAPDVAMNDCDYATGQVVDVQGTEGAAQLLQAKFTDASGVGIDDRDFAFDHLAREGESGPEDGVIYRCLVWIEENGESEAVSRVSPADAGIDGLDLVGGMFGSCA